MNPKREECPNCGKALSDCGKSCYYREDMSEEKEWKAVHRDDLASIRNEYDTEIDRIYGESADRLVEAHNASIKSLESRLKEAERLYKQELQIAHTELLKANDLEQRLKEAVEKNHEMDVKVMLMDDELNTAEERLSQAEAENIDLRHRNDNLKYWRDKFEARLSSVMDVAGKLEKALNQVVWNLEGHDECTCSCPCHKPKEPIE